MIENIYNALTDTNIPISIFIDLKKAFDTIDHNILLDKLRNYGIRGIALQWIQSYHSNRSQFVTCNNTRSNFMDILCGVPQGSILGPLLFIIYINDIVNVSEKLKFILFADDTNVFFSSENKVNLKHDIEIELKKLVTWLEINKLTMNVSKTNYMIFRMGNIIDFELSIKNEKLTRLKSIKFLGLYFDDELNWKAHIDYVQTTTRWNPLPGCGGNRTGTRH